jgi:glycosyltransferase involved in cell wall biosynthesis
VGEGPVKQQLQDIKRDQGLDNVMLLPEVPMTEVSRYINAADVMLVPLRKADLFSAFIPSKLFDYLACAKPVILTVDGEAREILDAAQGGVYVEPDDPPALARTVLELQAAPARLKEMGESGRRYVLEHYNRDAQGASLERILAGVCARQKR